jgi:hypothetical protein
MNLFHFSLWKGSILFLFAFLSCEAWAQTTVEFTYKEQGDDQLYKGTVQVGFEQIHDDGRIFVFSNVQQPVTLDASGDYDGRIRIWFYDLEWAEKKHRRNTISVRPITLAPARGLDTPQEGFTMDKNGDAELNYKIVSNGVGTMSVYFDVVANSGETTLRAGKVSMRYLMKREESAWENAKQQNTCEAYRGFLADYPSGRKAAEAQSNISRLCNQPPPRRPKPPTISNWEKCLNSPTKSCLETFLGTKQDLQANEMLDRMDDQEWGKAKRTNICQDFQRYLNKWSTGIFNGKYTYEAKNAIRRCDDASPVTPPPVSKGGEPDPELLAYQACVGAGEDSTVILCKQYLDDYPEGRYRKQVIERMPLEADPFERDKSRDDIFRGKLRYALAPLTVEAVILPLEPESSFMLTQSEEGKYAFGDSLLEILTKEDGTIEVTTYAQKVFDITIADATGRSHVFQIDASQPRLEILSFIDGKDSVIFSLQGGRPPYLMQLLRSGSDGVERELSLQNLASTGIAKIDILDMDGPKLNGKYRVRFLDERRTESVTADSTIFLEGSTSPIPYILGILLLLVLAWLGYNFFRKRKFS